MVQPMQIPPTFGQPPIPAIHPRLVTLQLTTGPQQPSFTKHSAMAIVVGKLSLLVIAAPIATFVDRLAEQPSRA